MIFLQIHTIQLVPRPQQRPRYTRIDQVNSCLTACKAAVLPFFQAAHNAAVFSYWGIDYLAQMVTLAASAMVRD